MLCSRLLPLVEIRKDIMKYLKTNTNRSKFLGQQNLVNKTNKDKLPISKQNSIITPQSRLGSLTSMHESNLELLSDSVHVKKPENEIQSIGVLK